MKATCIHLLLQPSPSWIWILTCFVTACSPDQPGDILICLWPSRSESSTQTGIQQYCVCVCVSGQRVQFGKCWSEAVKCITRWSFSGEGKRDEWLLLERGSFRGKVIFSWGGDEGEGKLRLLEPRLIKITSASRDKVNHPLCSSAENTHGPETWAVVAAGWPRRESSHPLRRSEVVTCR